jgi:hypothetical protein
MTATSSRTATWRFDGRVAHLHCGRLRGAIDVAAPRGGLAQLEFQGAALAGHLLGVDVEAEPNDAYVRGNDLVVAYRETTEHPFSVRVYWSAEAAPDGEALILDAAVSIQTRQWEAYPEVSLESSIVGATPNWERDGVALVRPANVDWSYAETALPEDFAGSAIPAGPGSPTLWRFANNFMERGVIRQLRVRGAFVPRESDAAAARDLQAALRADLPPLTA